MEANQELRYECKFCSKRFPSGKSLGGHMRSHVTVNFSSESEEKFEPNIKKLSSLNSEEDFKKDSKFELGGQSGYGLRENPRKTWRAVDSNSPLQREKFCKQCGKGFKSLKALCGHMACHSERVLKDDHSWTSENKKIIMDSDSDTEAEARIQRRSTRAASTRYKRIVVKSTCLGNFSSSVSSDVEQEQEEIAMCLMMLSRDSGNWGGLDSVTESSDNNSVVLETKSSSIDLRNGKKKGLTNCVYNGNETIEIKKTGERKLKSGCLDAQIAKFENSDSGYFRNGSKNVESDVSVDGFLINDEFRGNESRKRRNVELHKNFEKRRKYESHSIKKNPIVQDLSCRNVEKTKIPKKSKGHECPFCLRVFKSGQALGGHKRSHFVGGSQYKNNQTIVINQELPKFSELIDLNLPAPVEVDSLEAVTSMNCF